MTDVLLIVPSFSFAAMNTAGNGRGAGGYYLYYPPLGLCSIGACLKQNGISVRITDCYIERLGDSGILKIVDVEKPKLIGITTTTPTLPVVNRLIRTLKEHREKSGDAFKIVVGGAHISCDPEILPELGADFGIVGDGEAGMVSLALNIAEGKGELSIGDGRWETGDGRREMIAGLVTIQDSRVVVNPPAVVESLGEVPFPDRTLVKENRYFNPYFPARTTTLLSARGCPFTCAFCCRSEAMGAYRPRPIEEFLEEASQVDRAGYGFVSLIDETFTYDRARAAAIADGLLKRNIRFRWSAQTRAELVDTEIIRLMKKAGCINVSFGVESGNSRIRSELDKPISDAHFVDAFRICREAGVTTNAFVMIGNPDETEEDINKSIDFVIGLQPDYAAFNIATLFPGTKFYRHAIENGAIDRTIWGRYMRGEEPLPALSAHFSRDALSAFLQKGYSRFYLRPAYIMKKVWQMRSPRQLAYLARIARTVIAEYAFSF
ncbi:MAG: radical SAM protein [bacterium]